MIELYVDPQQSSAFNSVGAAIDALPQNDEACTIYIAPGIYREKITLHRSNTSIIGLGKQPEQVVLCYDDYAFDTLSDGSRRGTFRSYSFLIDASFITLKNLTISNTSGDENKVGQAIALYADGDHITLEHCRLTGRQDTLFTGPLPPKELQPGGFIGPKQFAPRINGHHLYKDCYICGNVDFIFGSATAYFDSCTIESLSHGASNEVQGYVTAPSTPEGQRYGYVFCDCNFISTECGPETVFLARPWRDYARSIFISCTFGPHIKAEGFDDWSKDLARKEAHFEVINCHRDDGSNYTASASFARHSEDTSKVYTLSMLMNS